MTTNDGGVGLMLLDQWHVDFFGPADMDDTAVERLRNRVDASLHQWATRANLGLAGVVLRVEQ